MSACATGCGAQTLEGEWLCGPHWDAWCDSPERRRWYAADNRARRDVARADFCNRTRAERSVRNNEVSRAE